MWKRAFKEFEGIWNFLKAVFHKFYLVHSWMFCPMPMFHFYGKLLWNGVVIGLNCSDLWFFRQSSKLPFWRFRLLSYCIVSAYFSSTNSCCQRSFFFLEKKLFWKFVENSALDCQFFFAFFASFRLSEITQIPINHCFVNTI